jgi:diketogulonate reductase-like aldo/keto reductase
MPRLFEGRFDLTLDAYRALEKLLADGKVRAIGVSNFMPEHLRRLLAETSIVPAVNQIEVHPYFQQTALQRLHAEHGILTQAWLSEFTPDLVLTDIAMPPATGTRF